jgi:formylglycine-generating enzyme required for sulfatase activity
MSEALCAPGKHVDVGRYHFRGPNPPVAFANQPGAPLIYHLLGAISEPASLVLTERDLLELLEQLLARRPGLPEAITAHLQRRDTTFLFLGFGLRQQYLRVLLHALRINRDDRSLAIEEGAPVTAPPDDTVLFYERGKITLYDEPVAAFVDELARRFHDSGGVLVSGGSETPGVRPRVFISYASEDAPRARRLFEGLERARDPPRGHSLVAGRPTAWKEAARRSLIVAFTPEAARQALAEPLKWSDIPAPAGGKFLMGCVDGDRGCDDGEKPRHDVRLPRGFKLMSHELTREEYARFVEVVGSTSVGRWLGPSGLKERSGPEGAHPMASVSWFEATLYCAVVGARLPTEAEWEYAARGGNPGGIYPWGNEEYSGGQANARGTRGRDRWEGTAPVGSFSPNGFGLFDMAGNVWEWTASVYGAYPYSAGGGRESSLSGEARVVRGGSFDGSPWFLRASLRVDCSPDFRGDYFGFRCARDGFP